MPMTREPFAQSEPTAARREVIFKLVDRTDNATPETGLTLTVGGSEVEVSKNGAAFGTSAGTAAEVGGGYYSYQFTAAELDTIGTVRLKLDDAAAAIEIVDVEVRHPAQVYGSAYQGSIWIDGSEGTSGSTVGIHGTVGTPCTTIAEADTLNGVLGIKDYQIIDGPLTLDATTYEDFTFTGTGLQRRILTLNSKNLNGCAFVGLVLVGTAGTGTWTATECTFPGTSVGAGLNFFRCMFSGTITIGSAAVSIFHQCANLQDGGGSPVFDLNDLNTIQRFEAWSGDISLANMTHASALASITSLGGKVTLAASNTDGAITVSGPAALDDSSAGTTVTSDANADPRINTALMMGNYTFDQIVYDSNGFMSSARLRLWDSVANVPASPEGSETAGLLKTVTITGTADTTYPTQPGSVKATIA